MVSDRAPSDDPDAPERQPYDYYAYRFAAERQGLHYALLHEVYDDYCGQTSWTPTALYDRYYRWIDVAPGACVLDVACGAGGPALRLARGAGCALVGIDINARAIATATALADEQGVADRVRFVCHDATAPLPFPDRTFDAIVCVDAIVGLPDRLRIFAEWARVLKPGGRLVFTDPVLTGPLSSAEFAARAPFFFVLAPPGYDEGLLEEAGFELLRREDVTADLAEVARRHCAARAAHADALRALEGDAVFASQNRYRATAELLAREGRLAHVAFLARRTA
jgi:SAM-dependent methyltransferase